MITVGRTQNNDVVLGDVQISRFHACFKIGPSHVELGDAGSVNGTFADGNRLAPKGAMVMVTSGARPPRCKPLVDSRGGGPPPR